jgi:CDP-diacylglycerol--glycerol-3-phosphate 3-phosphatidyltransferase
LFDGRFRKAVEDGVAPVGSSLGARRLKPDHLTAAGLVMAVACAVAVGSGHLLVGFVLLILSALPDLLDGAVAKATGLASTRGAFFDSVSDRVTDSLVLGAIAWHLSATRGHAMMLAVGVLGTSTLISYERAKAESLGFDAKGGLMERAERVIALCIGLAFPVLLVPVLWVMLVLTGATAVQRFVKVWRQAPGPAGGAAAVGPLAGPASAPAPTVDLTSGPPERRTTGMPRSRGLGAAARDRLNPDGERGAVPSRWREWREAAALRSSRATPDSSRWRDRRRTPSRHRRAGTAERPWRLRDRTRP